MILSWHIHHEERDAANEQKVLKQKHFPHLEFIGQQAVGKGDRYSAEDRDQVVDREAIFHVVLRVFCVALQVHHHSKLDACDPSGHRAELGAVGYDDSLLSPGELNKLVKDLLELVHTAFLGLILLCNCIVLFNFWLLDLG